MLALLSLLVIFVQSELKQLFGGGGGGGGVAMAMMPWTSFAQKESPAVQQPTTVAPQVKTVAQPSLHFAYFSFLEVFHTMPGYALAKHNMDDLRMKYDAETKRAEDEFNSKYEEFLDGQRSFAPSILEKRQAELRELMAKNMAFKAESERLLKQAEEEAYAPLKKQIKDVIQKIGKAKGFAFVLNVDGDSLPYVDAAMGEDITELIKENLK